MKKNHSSAWDALFDTIITCRLCPRLVEWREKVAIEKRRAYQNEVYWGKPVPGFGDQNAQILILGLAPGAHGSNRTGRMFTGDASGDFLYPALHASGFASQPRSIELDDGLLLKNAYITAVCRCAPPGNKPAREEQRNCLKYLYKEMALLTNLKGIVALGGIAFKNAFDVLKSMYGIHAKSRPKFGHNELYTWPESPIWLLAAYHPSRQNTQTGRLTQDMLSATWERANLLLKEC